jgi:DNA-directed RNA polymerase subunit RPC12/RpoP
LIYAVCTNCSFLRAYSTNATDAERLEACPACGAPVIIREREERFPPTYVSRVSLDLWGQPEVRAADRGR